MQVLQTEEFNKWLNKLNDNKARFKINTRIRRIAAQNHFGDSKPVGGGIFELRIDYGPGYRVYYAQRGEEIILLLIGGDKSSQQSDIEKAKNILAVEKIYLSLQPLYDKSSGPRLAAAKIRLFSSVGQST